MSADVDLLYTDVEESLRTSLRDLLASRCPADAVIATYDGDRSVVDPLWRSVAVDLGLAALLVPEDLGGAGASAREAAVVLEELGRAVAPVPFLTSSVVATAVLATPAPRAEEPGPEAAAVHAERNDAVARLVSDLAAGERTAALAVPFATSAMSFRPAAGPRGGGIAGRITSVAGALEADLLLVPVKVAGGLEVHVVETSEVTVEPVVSLDMSRQLADVSFDEVPSLMVVHASAGERVVGDALRLGAGLLASEQVGVAQWCLDTTVAYLKERRQFGRVVGGFQALKHRLADLYVLVEQARVAARYAAATAAQDDPDAEVAAHLAQAYCSDVAVRAAEECVQLHGGIGMTWEHPAHLYLKRAKADQVALGNAAAHRARLAGLVDLPA